MAHVRQQIRARLIADLTGLATTGSNVGANRVYPYEADALPGLNIMTEDESRLLDACSMDAAQYREMVVIIEARAKAASGVDDTLDTMVAEVEAALAGDPKLNGLVHYLNYESLEVELSGEGEQAIGLATLTYIVNYAVAFGDAETAL